jgi:hypothetical protein
MSAIDQGDPRATPDAVLTEDENPPLDFFVGSTALHLHLRLTANTGRFERRIRCGLNMRELEGRGILQTISKHPVHADVGNPDQAHFPEQSPMKQCSEDAHESGKSIVVHHIIEETGLSTRSAIGREQTQIWNQEEACEQHPVVRK